MRCPSASEEQVATRKARAAPIHEPSFYNGVFMNC
jgi:hypothetical protein